MEALSVGTWPCVFPTGGFLVPLLSSRVAVPPQVNKLNLVSVANCLHAASGRMVRQQRECVVNVYVAHVLLCMASCWGQAPSCLTAPALFRGLLLGKPKRAQHREVHLICSTLPVCLNPVMAVCLLPDCFLCVLHLGALARISASAVAAFALHVLGHLRGWGFAGPGGSLGDQGACAAA